MHSSLKSLLGSIEVGDFVWLVSYVNQPIYRKVTKVSKNVITASGGYKFERRNGTGAAVDSLYEIGENTLRMDTGLCFPVTTSKRRNN